MAADLIRYDLLVQDALRAVIRSVLARVAREGLPGEHHFYITFRTRAGGVRLSQRMRGVYPDEMSIVLQHQFWDLSVSEHAFEVGLSFQRIPEMLLVPFEAITRFADPAAGFELAFAPEVQAAAPQPLSIEQPEKTGGGAGLASAEALPESGKPREEEKRPAAAADPAGQPDTRGEPKVISIDAFRKKS